MSELKRFKLKRGFYIKQYFIAFCFFLIAVLSLFAKDPMKDVGLEEISLSVFVFVAFLLYPFSVLMFEIIIPRTLRARISEQLPLTIQFFVLGMPIVAFIVSPILGIIGIFVYRNLHKIISLISKIEQFLET